MEALLSSSRLLGPPPKQVFAQLLATLKLTELESVERLLAASPHNRQVCTGGAELNAVLALLPQFEDEARRAGTVQPCPATDYRRALLKAGGEVCIGVVRHF